MKQSWDVSMHSGMAKILSRARTLILLLSLLTGPVTAVTAPQQEVHCCREVRPELIRELMNRTRQLVAKLPKEEKPNIKTRLLPKFCTKCSEKAIGWLEIREMIDIYQSRVFSQDKIQSLLPLHFLDLLYSLQDTLHDCVSTTHRSKWSKDFKRLQKKIKRRGDGALKAVREFVQLLKWTGELSRQRVF